MKRIIVPADKTAISVGPGDYRCYLPVVHEEAEKHLSAADPVMREIISRMGRCKLTPRTRRSPFESLARAIASQQLHGKAAETILQRFRGLFPRRRFPQPADVLSLSQDQLRACGFSRAKVAALQDLAQKSITGMVPSSKEISHLSNEEIIARLTTIRGIGQWTVEMLLIFQLGRPDILPVKDFGVRRGFAIAYGQKEPPSPKDLLVYGEKWRPYRTIASWYLWRIADLN